MLKLQDFETGPDSTTLTVALSDDTGDAALSGVYLSGGSVVYRAANAFIGGYCVELSQAAGTPSPVGFQMSDTGATSFACRIYVRMTGYPSTDTSQFPIQLRSTTDAFVARLVFTAAGMLRITKTDGGNVVTGTVAATLNVWHRVEFWGSGLNGAAGTMSAALYLGHSTTAIDTITGSNITTAGVVDRIRYGRMANAGLTAWYFDGLAQNIGTATPIGPAAVGSDFVRRSGDWVAFDQQVRRSGAWL